MGLILMGAIAGDVIGSRFEFNATKRTDFTLFDPACDFTDDSVLTVAIADAILNGNDFLNRVRSYGIHYPHRGYGNNFKHWLYSDTTAPYNSYGNGSAMRVSPVGWAFDSVEEVLSQAEASAAITHNHPEGVKGAQAVALAIFMARKGSTRSEIKQELISRFQYNLNQTLDEIRPLYQFEVSCQESVPQSILAFLESNSTEDAIRKAISLGGDADTQACIAGSIAEAFYGDIPKDLEHRVKHLLPAEFIQVLEQFNQHYNLPPQDKN